jgi:hypothetical protein
MYTLTFKNQSLDPVAKAPIVIPVGTVNHTNTPLYLTGKGAGNYGTLAQDNLLLLLENFADTAEPTHPTIGMSWYDAANRLLKVCISTTPVAWKSLGGVQVTSVGSAPPTPAALGDLWYSQTGTMSGTLYVYTGLGRFPLAPTTNGGWEQIFPTVEVHGGRDEYDSLRELVEQLIGSPTGAYGSGAIGRSITNLADFASLDNDLRVKAFALGNDINVFQGVTGELSVTKQALSSTMFFHVDLDGTNPNEGYLSGSPSDTTSAGTIYLSRVPVSLPAGNLFSSLQVEDAYIMWDSNNALGTGRTYQVVNFDSTNNTWSYDNNSTYVSFTPDSSQYIVGTFSSFLTDTGSGEAGSIFPGDKNGFIWATAVPITSGGLVHIKVEPTSQDWDELLAAAKYALARLELPPSFVKAISSIPFVRDGLPAPTDLISLAANDVRSPSVARRSQRKLGIVTMVQNFAETVNALTTAISSRFSLKGINGPTGTNTAFGPTISIATHLSTSAIVASGNGDLQVNFNFADVSALSRWLYSGQGLQLSISHAGGATSADSNFRTFLATYGTWRLTADRVRFFDQSTNPVATDSPVLQGLWNASPTGTMLATKTATGVTMTITAYRTAAAQISVLVSFAAGGALGGTTTVTWSKIVDAEVYGVSSTPVYAEPIAYTTTDTTNPL